MADQDEIIQQLARKYHLSPAKVKQAVMSQYKFAKISMTDDSLPTIRIPYFGKFKPDKRKVKHINKNYKKKHGISRQQREQVNQQSETESKEES